MTETQTFATLTDTTVFNETVTSTLAWTATFTLTVISASTVNTTTDSSGFKQAKPRLPYTRVPDGCFTPRQLGFHLIGVRLVHVGHCGLSERFTTNAIGHAHDRDMCIRDGRYVYRGPFEPDDVILHEWAHIIAGYNAGHGYLWQRTAERVGTQPTEWAEWMYVGEPGDKLLGWSRDEGMTVINLESKKGDKAIVGFEQALGLT